LSVEIVNIVVLDYVNVDCLNVDACVHYVTTESELNTDYIKKECYETLLQQYHSLETCCISLEVNNQLNIEIFQRDTVSSSKSAPTFAELFKINELKAQVQEKDTVILKLKEKIKSFSGDDKERKAKREVEEIETQNLELDHKIRRTAQITKSEKTIVATSPSPNIDSNTPMLSSTGVTLVSSASGSKSQDNTKKNRIRRTQNKAKATELEDHLRTVKSSLNKASVVDSKATSSVIKKVWKSTGKVFKTVGYIWKPTGRTFTLVGNVCPLARIATATRVPPREPIPIVNSTDKPIVTLVVQIVLWYLDSGCSKHMTGDRSQLINFVQKFLGTVKFGNDHVVKIMGYGDYKIGNVTISRVYYVEGLG
nr:integrase, catalytic region, zinc finger, CCHC-type, peptidase aspartic, catalytic [Tanacetum cinerariifolium]